MDNLIVGTLRKSRIDGADRKVSGKRESAGESYFMLLRYSDVKETLWESFSKAGKSGAVTHG